MIDIYYLAALAIVATIAAVGHLNYGPGRAEKPLPYVYAVGAGVAIVFTGYIVACLMRPELPHFWQSMIELLVMFAIAGILPAIDRQAQRQQTERELEDAKAIIEAQRRNG